MNATLTILHWLSGFVVLAEALNKLERTTPCAAGLSRHDRVVDGLKALAWALLALGAACAVAEPILGVLGVHTAASQRVLHQVPSFAETAVLLGFAVLIVRTRVKEG